MADEKAVKSLAKVALLALGSDGFALAGSGAVREHGLIARATEDVDLFRTVGDEDWEQAKSAFGKSIDKLADTLVEHGYEVEELRRGELFSALIAKIGDDVLQIDLGCDYRTYDPVILPIGPVLDIRDAVGNKAAAVFSRGEARDYLDLDSIRQSGALSDAEIIDCAMANDAGFTTEHFAAALKAVDGLTFAQVSRYGMSEDELGRVKERLRAWGEDLFHD